MDKNRKCVEFFMMYLADFILIYLQKFLHLFQPSEKSSDDCLQKLKSSLGALTIEKARIENELRTDRKKLLVTIFRFSYCMINKYILYFVFTSLKFFILFFFSKKKKIQNELLLKMKINGIQRKKNVKILFKM